MGAVTQQQKSGWLERILGCLRTGGSLAALVDVLCKESPGQWEEILHGAKWLEDSRARLSASRRRLRYDWLLCRWVDADYVMAVAVGGPFHGQPVKIPREGLLFPRSLYTRHDYVHIIPYPQRYTVVLAAGTELPPTYETRGLAHRAKVIRWPSSEEMTRISCVASGVRYVPGQ